MSAGILTPIDDPTMSDLLPRFLLLLLIAPVAFAAPVVKESSGLAAGSGGLVWTHSDGPNIGEKRQDRNLYAFSADGALARVVRLEVRNGDWEDMASFVEGGRRYLLVADTGDNREGRSESQLYIMEEPKGDKAEIAWKIRFRYPDGPHDCEAVAVDMALRRVLLLTKREERAEIFALPLHGGDGLQTAAFLGVMRPLPKSSLLGVVFHPMLAFFEGQPTAMDIAPDQRKLVVLTYRRAYIWVRRGNERWEAALARDADQWISFPDAAQYEGAVFAPDGRSIYVSREGKDGYEVFPLK